MGRIKYIILVIIFIIPFAVYGQYLQEDIAVGTLDDDSVQITMDFFKFRNPPPELEQPGGFLSAFKRQPGLALIGSALIPGAGQAASGKWIRAGAYLLADAVLLGVHFSSLNEARKLERSYERFANQNFSVVSYAQWLVNYHDQNNIQNPFIDQLRQQIDGLTPAFDPSVDWSAIDLELLRNVERNTPFIFSDGSVGNNFSHTMPDFGSQQYYELISKYYQFGPGWIDFGIDRDGNTLNNMFQLNWNGTAMPANFITGAGLADSFNDNYRLAGNMVSLVILNHVVSAFDAYLTVKLNNKRLETETNLFSTRQFTLRYHF